MTTTQNNPSKNKAPSHTAYHVRDMSDGEAFWSRIGSAWAHGDGKGFTLQVEMVPLDGKIVLRVADKNS